MVHKIINNRFRVFVESFLVAGVIFLLGFSVGFYLEEARTAGVIEDYKTNELVALDLRLQNYYYQIMNKQSCDLAIEQNLIFADNLYTEGLKLERFEEANQVSDKLLIEKKRYVLLKTELLLNTLLLKEKCNGDFDIVVYFYSGDPGNTIKVAEQKMISNVLKELKEEKGNEIILIPIAGDLGLEIVELQKKVYKITELPSIVINEDEPINGFVSLETLKSLLN